MKAAARNLWMFLLPIFSFFAPRGSEAGYTCQKCYTSCAQADKFAFSYTGNNNCGTCEPCPTLANKNSYLLDGSLAHFRNTTAIDSCYISVLQDEAGTFLYYGGDASQDHLKCYFNTTS